MDDNLFQQLNDSIHKIMGDSKTQQQQQQQQQGSTPSQAASGASEADVERGYLHQCVAQLQPLPDDKEGKVGSGAASRSSSRASSASSASDSSASSESSSSSSSSAASSRAVSPSQAALPSDDAALDASAGAMPPPDPRVVQEMLARLDSTLAVAEDSEEEEEDEQLQEQSLPPPPLSQQEEEEEEDDEEQLEQGETEKEEGPVLAHDESLGVVQVLAHDESLGVVQDVPLAPEATWDVLNMTLKALEEQELEEEEEEEEENFSPSVPGIAPAAVPPTTELCLHVDDIDGEDGDGEETQAVQLPLPLSPPPPSMPLQLGELDMQAVLTEAATPPLAAAAAPSVRAYRPPLTVVARVRSFLAPTQQQTFPHSHLSVVNQQRLVVVNPVAFEDADPDVVVGLVAAMNRAAADGDLDSQEWARAFELDRAFWSADPRDAHFVNQAALYADLGAAVEHEAFVQGLDVTCFAYGAAQSGKTYTIFGSDAALQDPSVQHPDLGLLPRLLAKALTPREDNGSPSIQVSLSVLKISAEDALYDLLHDGKTPQPGPLRIREHPTHGPFVEHLTTTEIPTLGALHQLLKHLAATRRRAHGGGGGHVLATVYVKRIARTGAVVGTSRLHVVELAGVEKSETTTPSKMGTTTTSSPRRRYSTLRIGDGAATAHLHHNSVQQSLTVLGTALRQLGKGEDIASLSRSSPLTWLTKSALTNPAGAHAYLLLCLSPAPEEYHNNVQTLKFGEPLRLRDADDHHRPRHHDLNGMDPGTPVRDEDVHDWSLLHDNFDGLMRRLSGGGQQGTRQVLKEMVSDPQQRLVKLKHAMCEASQHPLDGSDDDDLNDRDGDGEDDDGWQQPSGAGRFGATGRTHAELEELYTSDAGFKQQHSRRNSLSNLDVGTLRARATELEIELQSMRVDRDVALAESRMANEELQRFKSQELTTKSHRIHELENALTALRHEYQELDRVAREHENERSYLDQLLEETKASHAEDIQRLEEQVGRLQEEKDKLDFRRPGARGSYEQLQRQLATSEQHRRQLAQDLQEALLKVDKAKLEASETTRANIGLQEETFMLRAKLQHQQPSLTTTSAELEALHQQQRLELMEQLRGADAVVLEQRRESCRLAHLLHERVLALEDVARVVDARAMRDDLRAETAALSTELRQWIEKMDRLGNHNHYEAPFSHRPYCHNHEPLTFPVFRSKSPLSAPAHASESLEGRLLGMSESLRQENVELKEKLRQLESRDVAAEYYCCDEIEAEDDEVDEEEEELAQLQMEAELARARQQALRLQQENQALMGELEDLDKLLVEAESEGISLLNKKRTVPAASSSKPPKAASNLEAVIKKEVSKALAGLNVAAAPKEPAAAAARQPLPQDKSTKQYLQLLERKRRQQRTPIPPPPRPSVPTATFKSGFAAPREQETRKGKMEWVRESRIIEDWIGSLRSPPPTPAHRR